MYANAFNASSLIEYREMYMRRDACCWPFAIPNCNCCLTPTKLKNRNWAWREMCCSFRFFFSFMSQFERMTWVGGRRWVVGYTAICLPCKHFSCISKAPKACQGSKSNVKCQRQRQLTSILQFNSWKLKCVKSTHKHTHTH